MRVCLDINVLVAAFATRGLCADVLRAVLAEHDLVIGDVILIELHRILTTKFKLPLDRIKAVEAVLAAVPSDLRIRDPADRWILATAVAGDADVLVTGDQDLLVVTADSPIPILDPRSFWELLRVGGT